MQRKQLRRSAMTRFFANSAFCLIDTETCGSSHHWVRKLDEFEQYGFIRMVSQAMVFIARRFLIFAALQFVVITRYYALTKIKNHAF